MWYVSPVSGSYIVENDGKHIILYSLGRLYHITNQPSLLMFLLEIVLLNHLGV
jgi:hypothetical protein